MRAPSEELSDMRRGSQQTVLSSFPFTLHQLVIFKVKCTSTADSRDFGRFYHSCQVADLCIDH